MNLIGWSNQYTELFQNIVSFSVSLYTYVSLYYYWSGEKDIETLRNLAWIIIAQCAVDLPLAQNEFILHHILTAAQIGLQLYNLQWPSPIHVQTTILVFLSAELSTVFYVLRNVSPNKNNFFMRMNDACFIFTFLGTRGYLMYTYVVANETYYNMLHHYAWMVDETRSVFLNIGMTVVLHGITWTFFGLNLYWCTLICKKLAKQLGAKGTTDHDRKIQIQHCESIVKWGGVAQLAILLSVYKNITGAVRLDISGVCFLAITTYGYHSALEKLLKITGSDWNINVLRDDVVDSYLMDIIMIHVRVPLYLISLVYQVAPNNTGTWFCMFVCCLLHGWGIIEYLTFIFELFVGSDTFLLEEPEEGQYKTDIISAFMGWPIGCSTLFVICMSSSVEYSAAKATIFVLLCLAIRIRPFYDYNHVYVHALLLVQTWLLCSIPQK